MSDSETKEVLLDKLIGIQDIEAAKQIEDMDTDLISECSEYIIELTGEEPPSESVLEQMKQRLLRHLFGCRGSSVQRHRRVLRKILVAAIVVILIVAMSISMTPLGTNDESLIHRWGRYISQMEFGAPKNFEDYVTLIKDGEVKQYQSIKQFVRKTNIDIFVPTVMASGYTVQMVNVYYDYLSDCVKVQFSTNESAKCAVCVYINPSNDELSEQDFDKVEQIGPFRCFDLLTPGWCQSEFMYNGNKYMITAESYEDLVLIIKNLKGSKE